MYIKLFIVADSFLSINVPPKQIFLHNKYINNNCDYERIINMLYLLMFSTDKIATLIYAIIRWNI